MMPIELPTSGSLLAILNNLHPKIKTSITNNDDPYHKYNICLELTLGSKPQATIHTGISVKEFKIKCIALACKKGNTKNFAIVKKDHINELTELAIRLAS